MTVTIRAAVLEDEDAVLVLIEELFEPPGGPPHAYTRERGREGFQHAVQQPACDVLLAVDGDKVVGLATVYVDYLSIRDGWRCWLQDMVVTASHRGRGIGKVLLDASTSWARERGCTHLDLISGLGRTDAHGFYLREGMSQRALAFRRLIE